MRRTTSIGFGGKTERKHPFIKHTVGIIYDTLEEPVCIRRSASFKDDYLYYKLLNDLAIKYPDSEISAIYARMKYLVAVVCTDSKTVKTLYLTERIKKGDVIWQAHPPK